MKAFGRIYLSKIDKALVQTDAQGRKYVEVDAYVNDVADQYGNILSISIYDKEHQERTYIGNLKRSQYNQTPSAPAPAPVVTAAAPAYGSRAPYAAIVNKVIASRPAPAPVNDDLPF